MPNRPHDILIKWFCINITMYGQKEVACEETVTIISFKCLNKWPLQLLLFVKTVSRGHTKNAPQALFTLVSTQEKKKPEAIGKCEERKCGGRREENTICPPVCFPWSCETQLPGKMVFSEGIKPIEPLIVRFGLWTSWEKMLYYCLKNVFDQNQKSINTQ